MTKVTLAFTLKKPTAAARKLATIDPGTLSVSVLVNALAPQVFNVAPGTGGCTASPPITCTETVNAPLGSDTFSVTTYSANNAGGVALDSGTTATTIGADAANSVSLTLMPVVSTKADSGAGSLRYALADASAGDTITFLPSALPAITLSSAIVITTNNLVISGPGSTALTINGSSTGAFEVDAGTAATFIGIDFNGGTCTSGCAFTGTGTMTLSGDDFESNCASVQGGAISAGSGSVVNVNSSKFNLNCVTNAGNAFGGAIYTNGALTVNNSAFTNNSATNISTTLSAAGGAIYADSFSVVSLLNDTFTSNSAQQAAASGFGNNARGGAIFSSGPLSVHGGTFTTNVATVPAYVQNSYGGAIDSESPNGTVTIDGAFATSNPVFTFNQAENGGAIEAGSGVVTTNTLLNASFSQNSTPAAAYGIGGALDIETGGGWTMSGLSFTNNSASANGGAIEYNAIGSVALSNSTFTSNSATNAQANYGGGAIDMELGGSSPVNSVTNVVFSGNTSSGIGGAVRDNVGYADIYQNCTFTNNSAALSGGALYDASGVAISGSTFSGNSATGNLSSSPAGGTAGAIFIYRVSTTISKTTIDSNTATDAGGGIFIEANTFVASSVSLTASTVSNNTVTASGYGGGGIYINNTTLTYPWTVSIINDTIYGNAAPNSDGGGIYSAAPNPSGGGQPVFIDFVTFSNNSASGNGGNLYANSAATLNPSSAERKAAQRRVQPQGGRRHTLGALCSTCALWLSNSVLVNGSAASGADFGNSVNTAGDYDFFGTAPTAAFAWGGLANQTSATFDTALGPFQLNPPGSTKTMAVPTASPLIGLVPYPASCDQTTDQRGNPRPGGANCTPGAYEYP